MPQSVSDLLAGRLGDIGIKGDEPLAADDSDLYYHGSPEDDNTQCDICDQVMVFVDKLKKSIPDIPLIDLIKSIDGMKKAVNNVETDPDVFTGVRKAELLSILAQLAQEVRDIKNAGNHTGVGATLVPQSQLDLGSNSGGVCFDIGKDDPKKLAFKAVSGLDCDVPEFKDGDRTSQMFFGPNNMPLNRQAAEARFVLPTRITNKISTNAILGAANEISTISGSFIRNILFPEVQYPSNTLLMYGHPGTGKSLIAESIPSIFEENFPDQTMNHIRMYRASASTIKSAYNGQTEARIQLLYQWLAHVRDELARELEGEGKEPVIFLFIDELESLLGKRGKGSNDTGPVVTSFLPLLDPKDDRFERIITVGATNLPWQLDTAVMRRFTGSAKVFVDLGNTSTITEILTMSLLKKIKQVGGKKDETKNGNPLRVFDFMCTSRVDQVNDNITCGLMTELVQIIANCLTWTTRGFGSDNQDCFEYHMQILHDQYGWMQASSEDKFETWVKKIGTDHGAIDPTQDIAFERDTIWKFTKIRKLQEWVNGQPLAEDANEDERKTHEAEEKAEADRLQQVHDASDTTSQEEKKQDIAKLKTMPRYPFGISNSDVSKLGEAIILELADLVLGKPTTKYSKSHDTPCVPYAPSAQCQLKKELRDKFVDDRKSLYGSDDLTEAQLCHEQCTISVQERKNYQITWDDLSTMHWPTLRKHIIDVVVDFNPSVSAEDYRDALYYNLASKIPEKIQDEN
jgi:SpoVK/Ycf46/Vps4 family AAA+-type ATPase